MTDKEIPIEFNDLREVMAYAHIGRQALYLAISKGRLKATKKGRKWSLFASDVDEYITSKYNRQDMKVDGHRVFDSEKGFFSVFYVAKMMTEELKRRYPVQRIYYLIRKGRLKAMRKGSAWVIGREDLRVLLHEELLTDSILQKAAD